MFVIDFIRYFTADAALLLYQEVIITIGLVLLVSAGFFFIAFLFSRKPVFFITTADGQEHHFDLKGLDSERFSRELLIGIRNAEKKKTF